MSAEYDVIVVGGGGAGMAAALAAQALGASVLLIEADKKLGGATMLSGGVFYAAGTRIQRAAGITDTPQAMYDYIMTLNCWRTRPDITRLLSELSGPALEWLVDLGADYKPEWTVCSGVDTVPRGHCVDGAGYTVGRVLSEEVGGKEIETILATRVERLIVENGAVVGIEAAGVRLRAKSVVVTTGGFGNSPGMRARFLPSVAQHGDTVFAVHDDAPFILGDGLKMGEMIGAAIVGQDTGLVLPSAGLGRLIEAFLPPWIMLVNERGQRFMAESAPYAVSGYLINDQPGAHAWAIFDEAAMVEGSADKRFSDPYNTGNLTLSWDEPIIRQYVAKGVIKTADTLPALIAQINIDGVAFAETLRRYNADAADGTDSMFFKQAPKYFLVAQPPYFAAEIRASIIGQTSAGLDVDTAMRVRDVHGIVIRGLYAAGETLGCVQGYRYAGGGMGVGAAVTFGRLAGSTAAKAAMGANEI